MLHVGQAEFLQQHLHGIQEEIQQPRRYGDVPLDNKAMEPVTEENKKLQSSYFAQFLGLAIIILELSPDKLYTSFK